MKTFIKFLGLFALLLTTTLIATAPVRADKLTFPIKSSYDYEVRLEFYSTTRKLYWPGNGKSWLLDDYQSHNYALNCKRGEQICYGAWEVDGTLEWGVGHQYSRSCTNCCFICNGTTTTRLINLTPN